MLKTFLYTFLFIFTTILFTACSTNTTSYKSEKSAWQQSQSEKEMKYLDKELQ